MAKAKKGDMRPVYQQIGWEVCKKEAEKPEDEEWVQTTNLEIADILSYVYKHKQEKE